MRKQIFVFIAVVASLNSCSLQSTIKCPSIFSCLFNWKKKNKVAPKNPGDIELSELLVDSGHGKKTAVVNDFPLLQISEAKDSSAASPSRNIQSLNQSHEEIDQQIFNSAIAHHFKKGSDSSSDTKVPPAPTPSPDPTPTHNFTKQDSSSSWDIADEL